MNQFTSHHTCQVGLLPEYAALGKAAAALPLNSIEQTAAVPQQGFAKLLAEELTSIENETESAQMEPPDGDVLTDIHDEQPEKPQTNAPEPEAHENTETAQPHFVADDPLVQPKTLAIEKAQKLEQPRKSKVDSDPVTMGTTAGQTAMTNSAPDSDKADMSYRVKSVVSASKTSVVEAVHFKNAEPKVTIQDPNINEPISGVGPKRAEPLFEMPTLGKQIKQNAPAGAEKKQEYQSAKTATEQLFGQSTKSKAVSNDQPKLAISSGISGNEAKFSAATSTQVSAQQMQILESTEEPIVSVGHSPETTTRNLGPMQNLPKRAELPVRIAQQLAEATINSSSRITEISLTPEELGRVKLSMVTTDAGIVMNIMTERAETLDLLRRHISQLQDEFQALGYQETTFSFSDQQSNRTVDDKSYDELADVEFTETPESIENKKQSIGQVVSLTAGLDLRV